MAINLYYAKSLHCLSLIQVRFAYNKGGYTESEDQCIKSLWREVKAPFIKL